MGRRWERRFGHKQCCAIGLGENQPRTSVRRVLITGRGEPAAECSTVVFVEPRAKTATLANSRLALSDVFFSRYLACVDRLAQTGMALCGEKYTFSLFTPTRGAAQRPKNPFSKPPTLWPHCNSPEKEGHLHFVVDFAEKVAQVAQENARNNSPSTRL